MSRAIAVALVAVAVLLAVAGPGLTAEAASPDSYTVQAGDTLSAIASKLGVTPDQLADWSSSVVSLNGLADANSIAPGQTLKMPSSSSSSSTAASSTTASTSASKGSSGGYTVQPGDTLYGIAAKQGLTGDQLVSWVSSVLSLNGLTSPDQLSQGQTLTLPASSSSSSASSSTTPSSSTSTTATTSSTTPSTSSSSATTSTSTTASAGATTSALSTSGPGNGTATSYGDAYNGRPMGCVGAGPYNPNDPTIIAIGPSMYGQVPCGTPMQVCGPSGCIAGMRKDACPGCSGYSVDLSNAGLMAVCGGRSCTVSVRPMGSAPTAPSH